jgi:hypothetical protein
MSNEQEQEQAVITSFKDYFRYIEEHIIETKDGQVGPYPPGCDEFTCWENEAVGFRVLLTRRKGKRNGLIVRHVYGGPNRKVNVDGDFVRQMVAKVRELQKMDKGTQQQELAVKEIIEQVKTEFEQHESWSNRRGGW